MDKLEFIIREKQAELKGLQAELNEALTGIESPDYETAGRIQPLIYGVMAEIERLERLLLVRPTPRDFQFYLSSLLTDDTCTVLELWTQIKDYWSDVTIRLLEIRKLKTSHGISCTLRLIEPADRHLNAEWTTCALQHIGWKASQGGRAFYYKTRLRSPDHFDAFCQMMSVTLLESLASLWRHGQQYFRYR
ncbi:hypothetical protein [Puia dinghuensis]|uniref:Uncharacterized protein n=1 Tax=Puia dinghuensis TaxID=1792502 RepID=A0A8J2UHS5_9BACT|nr:hypothetical protein [Puia dinghuensis]GGB20041.1 hypothetical protein GCM10011511_49690 [Puia dinghuensis]